MDKVDTISAYTLDMYNSVVDFVHKANTYLWKIELKYYYVAAGAGLAVYYIYKLTKSKRPSNIPPGLPAWPVVGSLPYLNNPQTLHKELTANRLKYGNVYSLYMGNQ